MLARLTRCLVCFAVDASNHRENKFRARPKLKTFRLFITLPLFCGLGVFASADDSNPKSAALTGNPIYQKDCAKCHGKTAEGRHFGGPSLLSAKTASASADDLHTMIANGKGRMPKFGGKLQSADIETLVEQIKAAGAK